MLRFYQKLGLTIAAMLVGMTADAAIIGTPEDPRAAVTVCTQAPAKGVVAKLMAIALQGELNRRTCQASRQVGTECSDVYAGLIAETRLLFPYSSECQKPWFWRVDYTQGAKHNTIFLLGSAHSVFPTESLPVSVLKHMDYADAVLSEMGAEVFEPYQDEEFITKFSIERALHKDGSDFGPATAGDRDGWLALVPDYLREPLRNIIRQNMEIFEFREEEISNLHLMDPRLYVQTLQPAIEDELGVSSISTASHLSTGCMDTDISRVFSEDGKRILALEDEVVRKDMERKALRAGQTYGIDTVESAIETLKIWLLNDPEDNVLREENRGKMLKENSYYKQTLRDYINGYAFPAEEDKTDYDTNFRNQYWIENTLHQALQSKGPTLVLVGNAHLDYGWFEHIGKTGLLNFFQKLQDTDTSWHGIRVRGIQRLVSTYPDSDLTSERNQYHWVEETVSTEGPYLEGLMARLRAGELSGGGGAAISPGGATG